MSRNESLAIVSIPSVLSLLLMLGSCQPRHEPPLSIPAGPFRIEASFSPAPPAPGRNTMTLGIHGEDDQPVENAEVRALATMAAMGTMPEMRAPADVTELGHGRYRLVFDLAMPGTWRVALHVHAPDGREAEVDLSFATGIAVRVASAPDARTHRDAGDEVAYYTCSMHPSVRSSTPGTCPICAMNLVPVTAGELGTGILRIDATRRQAIGVETGRAERRPVSVRVRTVGKVAWNETRLTDVTMKVRGWVGEVFADYTGARVEKGKPLFTLYAPELLAAQEELIESVRRGSRDAAARRLRLWNLTPSQIRDIAASGKPREYVPILSPATGIAIEKNVVAGSTADAGMRLYRIADSATLWVEAEVYEGDLPLVEPGQKASVSLSYLPGEQFSGEVSWVSPYLEAPTRAGRVRIELPNERGVIRTDMYATVEIEVPLGDALVVPEDAVVMAGTTNLVFLDLGEGRLRPQKVRIGRRTPDGYVVLEGLRDGDVVVTSGNFLIAAESKLKSGASKW